MDKINSTVILLHSALGTSEDLLPLENYLREYGHDCCSFNFSGHGAEASDPKDFRIDFFAEELDDFIKKNALDNPVIFGHSMGGYVALYHKANYEDSPVRAILGYGVKFNWTEQAVLKELPMLNPEHIEQNFPQHVENLKKKHNGRWKQLLRLTAHMIQNLEKLDGLTKEDLNDINIPVTLLLGDQDRLVTTEETSLASANLQKGCVKTITNSKHDIERANLKEIAQIIDQSVRENSF